MLKRQNMLQLLFKCSKSTFLLHKRSYHTHTIHFFKSYVQILRENILKIRTHIIGMQQKKVFEKTRFMRCNSMGGTIYKLPMKADGEQQLSGKIRKSNFLEVIPV